MIYKNKKINKIYCEYDKKVRSNCPFRLRFVEKFFVQSGDYLKAILVNSVLAGVNSQSFTFCSTCKLVAHEF